MDPINASPAATDYVARPLVTPLKPAGDAPRFTPSPDDAATVARKAEPLPPKPDQVKNRETDEQVTRQRTEDKFRGTLFDLRA